MCSTWFVAAGIVAALSAAPVFARQNAVQTTADGLCTVTVALPAPAAPGGRGGTIYLTDDGVILVDSKNDRMHDDIVAKVRSLTDKPIKHVVLTHNHQDHL